MDLGFLPRTDAANENEGFLEATITRELDRRLGSDVVLELEFLDPDPLTENDAVAGQNTLFTYLGFRHHVSVRFLKFENPLFQMSL